MIRERAKASSLRLLRVILLLCRNTSRNKGKYRLLIMQHHFIGDLIFTTSLIRPLHERLKNVTIDYFVNRVSSPIVQHNSLVNYVFIDNTKIHTIVSLRVLATKLIKNLKNVVKAKANKYTHIIDCTGTLYSASLISMIAPSQVIGISSSIVFEEFYDYFKYFWDFGDKKIVYRYTSLLEYFGVFVNSPEYSICIESDKEAEASKLIDVDKTTVLIAPFAGWLNKEWPVSKISEICRLFDKNSTQIFIAVSADDRTRMHILNEQLGDYKNIHFFVGYSLQFVIALLKNVDYFIGMDSALSHVADAYRKRGVIIFGGTRSEICGPLNSNLRVIQSDIECRPKTNEIYCGDNTIAYKCPIKQKCMRLIDPQSVFEIINESTCENNE
ncbi:MAG: hypothetical protein GF398_09245 [Chitinivibrionales bacterium]|nr:hypothetical protein [Chitinivibrionales bacterium]